MKFVILQIIHVGPILKKFIKQSSLKHRTNQTKHDGWFTFANILNNSPLNLLSRLYLLWSFDHHFY